MLTNNLGYPRVGANRELKNANEKYWAGDISRAELFLIAKSIREKHWKLQQDACIDLIPCNDFSFYDQVLDMSLLLGVIPKRYTPIVTDISDNSEIDLYFAMARGYQKNGLDIAAMEMTKWFDTNYHFIVPEFSRDQEFRLFSSKLFTEYSHSKSFLNKTPKPVLIGPVSYLLLGKEKDAGYDRIDLIQKILPVYIDILNRLKDDYKADWVQLDEPFLSMDLTDKQKAAFIYAYAEIKRHCPFIKTLVTTYFESIGDNIPLAAALPVCALHLDLVRAPGQLEEILKNIAPGMTLSLGLVDGRNVWINDYESSLRLIGKTVDQIGEERVMIAPSCSLIHIPYDLDLETDLPPGIRKWMAFSKQKLREVSTLNQLFGDRNGDLPDMNKSIIEGRNNSPLIHNQKIKDRITAFKISDSRRLHSFSERQKKQHARFGLPLFPTTTIGSFPQTQDIRGLRLKLKKEEISLEQYDTEIKKAIMEAIRWQEEIGLDVLVHGEFERNDMVEYFGEQLNGFLFTKNGWVQSYGSRCVKPPVIYGDVSRPGNMTVRWSEFAQSQTQKPMKGMLTGPVTILQWSFVRDDQPRSLTAMQIALAIRDEVTALEDAGIGIIQIDEPALREGLPLRKKDWITYLDWAVRSFRISSSGVRDETQIHTHMCYSEFNDIIEHIAAMDADVITIETSRSHMELLDAFADFKYPNEIGPGVYDIHSPRVPSVKEMTDLLEKASVLLPAKNIWVNPDCGLKTRKWPETKRALMNMVEAAAFMRSKIEEPA